MFCPPHSPNYVLYSHALLHDIYVPFCRQKMPLETYVLTVLSQSHMKRIPAAGS